MRQCLHVSFLLVAAIMTTGCSQRAYYAPPPPQQFAPPITQQAEHNGFHVGVDDGFCDSYNEFGYHPKRDRAFHDTPGYDPRFGPFQTYQKYFRDAYRRGYDKGFYHR